MSGSSSGTYNFTLYNSSVVIEAFERIRILPQELTSHHFLSARNSLNLLMIEIENAGFQFWKLASGTLTLVAGQATYTLPTTLVTVEEVYYSQVNAFGSGVNLDRIMIPMTRTEYAELTNKLQQGIPTRYWAQMTYPQQMTLWEVPAAGQTAPTYVVSWYGLQQMQDAANMGANETPDAPRRAWDALCAKLAVRLCEKFGPAEPQAHAAMMAEKVRMADMAWELMQRRDQEPGNVMTYRPRVGVYGRMGL